MAHLSLSHDQIHNQLVKLSSLSQSDRDAVFKLITHLSGIEDWYPQALRRELQILQAENVISETDRHAVEHAFFPEHTW